MSIDDFVENRNLLFTVAYEMLGSAADAEDIIQEAWLRWETVNHAEVRDPRAYLVRIVTRKSLDRLRTLARQREQYVGQWLPEPVMTSPDVAEDFELAESVSIAMLTVLETLGPTERAVFVLREVFATPYEEVAAAIGKSTAATRQICHRARAHVEARHPRMQVTQEQQLAAVNSFVTAVRTGDMSKLMDVLAPDCILISDGGGIVAAALRPLTGADMIVAFLAHNANQTVMPASRPIWLNGSLGVRIDLDGELNTAVSMLVEDGLITRIYAIRNPQKFTGLRQETPLTLTCQ